MKKLALIFLCIFLTGCQAVTFTVDGLLSAPKVADEQSAIYQALIESAGRNITLVYPRGGDYRSAFVLHDVDGDHEEEALAFYSVNSVSDSNVKISVLDRDDGSWRSMYELAGAGSSVERVVFFGSDMIVGYSAQDYEENAARMYRYSNGILEPIYEGSYSIMEIADYDGCGSEEAALVRRSGGGVEIEMLKEEDGDRYSAYKLQLETGAAAISSSCVGKLFDYGALYLDIAYESGGLATEIVYLGGEAILCPTMDPAVLSATQRPAGYSSRDYDGDGAVEVPTVLPFTGYEGSARGETEYMTVWLSYTDGGFLPKASTYYDVADGYIFNIPNRWLNMVTVKRDPGTGEVTFCRYDQGSDIANMTPIMSFAEADGASGKTYESSGYSVLKKTDLSTYYYKTVAGAEEPLVLTLDEIKDNFYPVV